MLLSPRSARRATAAAAAVLVGLVALPASATATSPATTAASGVDERERAGRAAPTAERSAATASVRGLDLDSATIPQLQERMAAGELTAVQLTRAYLQRIRRVDPDLGAVLAVNPAALAEARASDRARRHGGPRGALEGIPVLLKDNVDAQGMATTAGSRAMLGTRPDDATLTAKLRAAGAVVIGKANLSEWANFRGDASTSGWSGVGGQTGNPYVLDRNPCGSSSGSGAGVAASLAQVAIGTETDGSIVCPAGANGIVGVKPTLGLVSRDGVVPISAEQDTAGPMARHAVDAAIVLDVIAGEDPADAATLANPDAEVDYTALDADALDGARVGVWTLSEEEREAVGPDTAEVFDRAAKEMEAAGATTVPVRLDYLDLVGQNEGPALTAEFKRDLNAYLAATPGAPADLAAVIAFNEQDPVELAYFGQETMLAAQAGEVPADDAQARAARIVARSLARASIDEALAQGPGAEDDLDAVVGLTGTPAWKTRYASVDGEADRFAYATSTPAAVAGYPNVAVPAGFAGPRGALPVGVSFTGAQWDDAGVLSLAYSFEQATHARRAPGYLPTLGE
ncbi:amidase [Kineococcus sp. SYSU DK005]|uniref:amidase n=1 Tax=Kineococcus sp. SYSU DK005 TaxID=3383126 RepID=UPI003D7E6F4E